MEINIWYILVAAILFFAFGFGVSEAINFGVQRQSLKRARLAERMVEQFAASCRIVLSDAWYKKVIRHWRAALVREFHAEDGAEAA